MRRQLSAGSLKRRARGSDAAVVAFALEHRAISSVASGAHQAGLEHAPHQFVEIDAGRARRHRHQAVIGHARHGVDLEQQRPPGAIHHEIGAAPAFGAAGLERGQRQLRQVLLRRAPTGPRDRSSACHCADTWPRSRRSCAGSRCGSMAAPVPAGSTTVYSAPVIQAFGEHRPVRNAARCSQAALQILGPLDTRHADARALRARLDDQRQAQALQRQCPDPAPRAAPRTPGSERRPPAPGAWCAACPCRWPNPARRCRYRECRGTRARPARCRPRPRGRAARSRRDRCLQREQIAPAAARPDRTRARRRRAA